LDLNVTRLSQRKMLLFQAMGQVFTEEEFDELCFEFGLELDEVVTEKNDAGKDEIVYKVSHIICRFKKRSYFISITVNEVRYRQNLYNVR
jgi:hypothetical protein